MINVRRTLRGEEGEGTEMHHDLGAEAQAGDELRDPNDVTPIEGRQVVGGGE